MSKVLFFTWPGDGNQTPAIGLAQQLRREGHETLFAGYPNQASRFEGVGFNFVALTRSAALGEPFNPADLMGWLVRNVWACSAQVADVTEIADQFQPNLIIVDCLMGAVLAAVETTAFPAAALVHSTPGALAPAGGPLDAMVTGELNRIRSNLSLTPVDSYWQAWKRHGVLNASIPDLDPAGAAAFDPSTWIGPVFEDFTPSQSSLDESDKPLVLVSFSSGAAWDQTSRIQRTIDGLAHADVRVIVTAGATDPKLLQVPSTSITVVTYAPHGAILPRASAVVTHAGHGTLTAALAHGLPIVAIPNDAADQPALAEQTERLGAGIHLADDRAVSTAIAAAVRAVLDKPSYAAKARELAERVRSYREQPMMAVANMLEHPRR